MKARDKRKRRKARLARRGWFARYLRMLDPQSVEHLGNGLFRVTL
jgi:hypothetical protein